MTFAKSNTLKTMAIGIDVIDLWAKVRTQNLPNMTQRSDVLVLTSVVFFFSSCIIILPHVPPSKSFSSPPP